MAQHLSETIRGWLGWCPNTPALHTAPAVLVVPPDSIHPAQPDGGAGQPGKIHRGITFALTGTKILVRNRQLLWFSLMTGLVIAFTFIVQYGLHLLGTYPYDAIDFSRWLVLTFAVELVSVFFQTVLLAGLVLSILPGETGRHVSFREGLSRTKGYLRPLADWSVIMALCGTALFVPIQYSGYLQYTLYPVLDQFPFNFILFPEVYSTGPIGGTFAMLSAVTSTLALSGINALLFVLTRFVVPLLVLENRRLPEAVAGSVALMKKVRGEMAACFLALGLVVFAVALASLLFQVVYGIVAPDRLLFWYPGDAWIAAAALYLIALLALAVIVSTIAGIAVAELYQYGKSGRVTGADWGSSRT